MTWHTCSLSVLMQEIPKRALGPRPEGGTGRKRKGARETGERCVRLPELRRGPDGNLQGDRAGASSPTAEGL